MSEFEACDIRELGASRVVGEIHRKNTTLLAQIQIYNVKNSVRRVNSFT